MTKEQLNDYISSGGKICPYCGEEDLQGITTVSVNDGVGIQVVECFTCKKTWNDIYKLINIVL
jgi:hypothetical protein